MTASRALAHQCSECGRCWALRVVDLPEGRVVACRFCAAVRAMFPVAATA